MTNTTHHEYHESNGHNLMLLGVIPELCYTEDEAKTTNEL